MKSSWDLTYQNSVLIVIAATLFILLLAERYDLDKSKIKIECLQSERATLDSMIAVSELREKARAATLDSLSVRDSLLVLSLGKTKEFKLINDTTISNDSLRAIFNKRNRSRR